MNSKMTTKSQLSTTEPKKQKQNKQSKLEQEQNPRTGDHMEGYQQVEGEWGGANKVLPRQGQIKGVHHH